MDVTRLKQDTVVEMKKAHPCGGVRFAIVRTGADFKIRCLTCGRTVLLPPDALLKRVRRIAEGE